MSEENATTKRYRFRVRDSRGKELTSDVISMADHPDLIDAAANQRLAIHLKVADDDGHPLVSRPFEITVGDQTVEGTTSSEGMVEARIPQGAEAQLIVHGQDGDQQFTLALGKLAAPTTVQGAQERLRSMGYACSISGKADAQTQHAVQQFQHDHKLPMTGKLDATTSQRIDAAYKAAAH